MSTSQVIQSPSVTQLDQLCINTIRTLSIDAVQQANSGHPGTPMALAPLVYTIWNRVMNFDPKDPIWPNRDRFVLSNGHASMLLWSVLHLTRTQAVNADYETARSALGHPRRHPPLPPARQQSAGPSGVSLGVGRRGHHRPAGAGHRHQRGHGDRAEVARRPLQPARFRGLRLQHLCRLRRRLPDGGRRLGSGLAGRRTWVSTICAGSTTTTTSPSKATRALRSPRTSRRDSSAMAGTCCGSATPTIPSASSTRLKYSARPRAGPH